MFYHPMIMVMVGLGGRCWLSEFIGVKDSTHAIGVAYNKSRHIIYKVVLADHLTQGSSLLF